MRRESRASRLAQVRVQNKLESRPRRRDEAIDDGLQVVAHGRHETASELNAETRLRLHIRIERLADLNCVKLTTQAAWLVIE